MHPIYNIDSENQPSGKMYTYEEYLLLYPDGGGFNLKQLKNEKSSNR